MSPWPSCLDDNLDREQIAARSAYKRAARRSVWNEVFYPLKSMERKSHVAKKRSNYEYDRALPEGWYASESASAAYDFICYSEVVPSSTEGLKPEIQTFGANTYTLEEKFEQMLGVQKLPTAVAPVHEASSVQRGQVVANEHNQRNLTQEYYDPYCATQYASDHPSATEKARNFCHIILDREEHFISKPAQHDGHYPELTKRLINNVAHAGDFLCSQIATSNFSLLMLVLFFVPTVSAADQGHNLDIVSPATCLSGPLVAACACGMALVPRCDLDILSWAMSMASAIMWIVLESGSEGARTIPNVDYA